MDLHACTVEKLRARLGEKVLEVHEYAGECTVTLPKEAIPEALRVLRDDPELRYRMLTDLTSIDHSKQAESPRFSVVYHLLSQANHWRFRLRTQVEDGEAVPTASRVYPSANWLEREVWDLMGIRFEGHPDLRRIMMPEDYEGHPLRKEFPLEGPDVRTGFRR